MRKKILISILIIFAALITVFSILYLNGREYYSTHFRPNTTIDGIDVSGIDMDEYVSEYRGKYPDTFTIIEKDGNTIPLSLENVIINHDLEDFVREEKENAPNWFMAYFNMTNFSPDSEWNISETALQNAFDQTAQTLTNRKSPQDAYFDPDSMEIVPEEDGNMLDFEKVYKSVMTALNDNKSSIRLTESHYAAPEIKSDDPSLTSIVEERDSYIQAVNIYLAGSVTEKLKKKTVRSWLQYEDGHFDFDTDKINEYIDKLADKYDTAYKERIFTTSSGNEIIVGNGPEDNYGGYIMDRAGTVEELYRTLTEKGSDMTCLWEMTGYTMDENGDIGGTYIEISIPQQYMWVYQDGSLIIETPVITGMANDPKRSTPTGLFCVMDMKSPYVMIGENNSYRQPCDFFIRVTGYGVAIHDAPWQNGYFGDSTAYTYRGSHGCINTPSDAVQALWSMLTSLDNYHIPIIIY